MDLQQPLGKYFINIKITKLNFPNYIVIHRHLLSADTKEDRLEWCSKLNKTLNLIHAWGGTTVLS